MLQWDSVSGGIERMSGNILKRGTADDMISGAKQFNFRSVEADARQILEEARRLATEQIENARREVEKMRAEIRQQEFETARKEGYDKGFQEGVKAGAESGRKQAYDQNLTELREAVSELPTTLTQLTEEFERRRHDLIEDAESDLLALAYTVAEKVLHMKLATDRTVVQRTLQRAIDLVLKRASLDVMVSTDDVMAIEEYMPELRKIFGDLGAVRLHADMTIPRGSVVVRTGRGEVGLRLEDMMTEIAALMIGEDADDMKERLEKYEEDAIFDVEDPEQDVFSTLDPALSERLSALDRLKALGEVQVLSTGGDTDHDMRTTARVEKGGSDPGVSKRSGTFTRVMRAFDEGEVESSGDDSGGLSFDFGSTDETDVADDLIDASAHNTPDESDSQKSGGDSDTAKRTKGAMTRVITDLVFKGGAVEAEGSATSRINTEASESDSDTSRIDQEQAEGTPGKLTETLDEFDTEKLSSARNDPSDIAPDGSLISSLLEEARNSEEDVDLTNVNIDDLLKGE